MYELHTLNEASNQLNSTNFKFRLWLYLHQQNSKTDHTVALVASWNALATPSCWGSCEVAEWFNLDVFDGPASDFPEEFTSAYKE